MKKDSIIYYIIGAVIVGLAVALAAVMFFGDTTEKSARVFFEKVLVPNVYSSWNFDKFKGYIGRKAAPAAAVMVEDAKYLNLFNSAADGLGTLKSISRISTEKTEYIDIDSGKTVFVDINADTVYAKGNARLKTKLVQSEDSWKVVSVDVISAALIAKPAADKAQPQKGTASSAAQSSAKPQAELKPEPKKSEVVSKSTAPAVKPAVQQSATEPKKVAVKPQTVTQPAVKPKTEQKTETKNAELTKKAPEAVKQSVATPQPQTAKQPAAVQKSQPKSEEKPAEKAAAGTIQPLKNVSYSYDPKNRRDPFYPLIVKADAEKKPGLTPLENYEITDFKLIAILKEKVRGYYAVVTLPNNRSYNLKEGTKIGMRSGKVLKIDRDSVVIREYHRDLKGVLSPKDTILKLRREEEG